MSFHIVETRGEYIIVETFAYGVHHFSKIYPTRFKDVDSAEAYAIMLDEDGVPANSVSCGNIAKGAPDMGVSPLLLKKKLLKRKVRENDGGED